MTRWMMVFWAGLLSLGVTSLSLAQEHGVWVDETELRIQVVPAKSTAHARILWLPSEYGVLPQEKQLAAQLSQYGIESWFVDVYSALFLPPTASAVEAVPTQWITQLIQQAKQPLAPTNTLTSPKNASALPLWIMAPNKAAQLALRGLVALQQTPINNVGLVLINPNLYLNTPSPGEEAQYWSQVFALNLPITLFQAEQSPWRWRATHLAESLQTSGSDVFVMVQKNVRDRFYFRPDALPEEQAVANQFANKIRLMMKMQGPYLAESRQAGLFKLKTGNQVKETRSAELQVYQGEQNRTLQLENLLGDQVALSDYQGQVVLLNFWASWCPPCVHEMPSMARLKTEFANQPFEILAVNLAEPKAAIQTFTEQRPVNFPILLDPSGSAVKSWQVFAYPSTYIIDKKGQIRYALFGGTEWDNASHVKKIRELIALPND